MRLLIAILSCHQYADRRQAQRETWLSQLRGADYRFFLGMPTEPASWDAASDEEYLDCPDDYESLCQKTRAVMQWAQSQDYEFTFKYDDDSFAVPDRLLASGFERHAYSGFTEPGWEVKEPFRFAQGGAGYCLGRHAIDIVAAEMIDKRHCEDVAVGQTLARYGIHPFHDERYRHEENRIYRDAWLTNPSLISLHKCDPAEMRRAYQSVTH